ncbi:MAG TPA: protein-glutamate O-methyltransferase CheR [Paludibacter sp.]|nr:protein-glutamate O-methyltransferase CheR [Paludibacter sp.]
MSDYRKQIVDALLAGYNFDLSKYDKRFFEKLVTERMAETQCSGKDVYCDLLTSNKPEAHKFVDMFTVSYSEFFRDSLTFSVLDKIVLPHLISANKNMRSKEIRVWSAACASGQEVYSLAMLLNEHLSGDNSGVRFRIFGTDASFSQVQLANAGHYTKASLNNLTVSRIDQWFEKQEGMYVVNHELRKNIEFSVFDLFDPNYSYPPASIFGEFDLVFCSNVLFYYSAEHQREIIKKVNNSLVNDGLLIMGETERELLVEQCHEEIYPHSSIFRKKAGFHCNSRKTI